MIHESLFCNEELTGFPVEVRFLYIAIIVHCDDFGRMRADTKYVRLKAFPYDIFTTDQVKEWLDLLQQKRKIQIYEKDGKRYLSHNNWPKWQLLRQDRARVSHCPPPPGTVLELYPWINDPIIEGHLDKRSKVIPFWLRKKILIRDEFTCRYCSASLYDDALLVLALDHVIPFSKGGRTEEENLVTSCTSCNCSKIDRSLDECGMKLLSIDDADKRRRDAAQSPQNAAEVSKEVKVRKLREDKRSEVKEVKQLPSFASLSPQTTGHVTTCTCELCWVNRPFPVQL